MTNLHTSSGGWICGSCKQPHPENHTCMSISANPYYTLWHKSYKMNNNLYFGITQNMHKVVSINVLCTQNFFYVHSTRQTKGELYALDFHYRLSLFQWSSLD